MRRTHIAKALAAQGVAILCILSLSAPARSQEFRRLFSANLSTAHNVYQGQSAGGNTISHLIRFQSVATVPIVIDGVANVESLDPEDVGFSDLAPDNTNAAHSAVKALYPDYDFFSSTGWVTANPTRKTWQTELVFESSFPILINPGDYLEFTRVSRNNVNGPTFGPLTAVSITASQVEAIGEVIVAVDFDWHYVPEPASGAMSCVAALGFVAWTRKRLCQVCRRGAWRVCPC
jgi:hypothetical protein